MKKKRIAINGFGRIGRLTVRNIIQKYSENIDIIAINDLSSAENLAYLYNYDSTYHSPEHKMHVNNKGGLTIKDNEIQVFSQKNPLLLPWENLNIDIVIECTGHFNTSKLASQHITSGAKKVLLSAPSKDKETYTTVLGVNSIDSGQKIISNASCTTNCIAPVLYCLEESFGITRGSGITVHAFTSTQSLQDSPSSKDFRKSRAATVNLIPSSTGASDAITEVIPVLAGKISLSALRVPVNTGSFVQLVLELKKDSNKEDILKSLENYCAKNPNIAAITKDPIVSTDIIGTSQSVIIDSDLLQYKNNLLTIVLWYDNEWGYSARLADLTNLVLI
jgi:glyceraldehyde 3-phosphate dehydrogenase